MINTKSIMVAAVMIAIASVALAPLMSSPAFADYGYAKSNITQCNYSANYSTEVYQGNAGDDVYVGISVPGSVCDQNFTQATITIKDGNAVSCVYTFTATNGNDTKSCGSFDLGSTPLFISASVDYGTHTVNYSQTDNTT
jgi:major membrane immunogen (membrane-anchored lipoprotein)